MTTRTLAIAALDDRDLLRLRRYLTKRGSDFNQKLHWIMDGVVADYSTIAIVKDRGQMLGWARSEKWTDGDGREWDTLEAFVADDHRRRGVARLAATALAVEELLGDVAVFHPHMLLVAAAAGLRPTLFTREGHGWARV